MRRSPVRQWLRLLMVAGGAAGLSSCLMNSSPGIARSSGPLVPTGSRNRALREVYVQPGVVQYFLLPQTLEGPADQSAELDIVVRDSAQVPLYGLLHLSVVAPTAVRFPVDTLLLSTSGRPIALAQARVLFSEPKGAATLTRLEVYLTSAQTVAYLCSSNQAILLGGATRQRFQPGKKATVALAALASQAVNCGQ